MLFDDARAGHWHLVLLWKPAQAPMFLPESVDGTVVVEGDNVNASSS